MSNLTKVWTDGGSRSVNGETHGGWGCYFETALGEKFTVYGPGGQGCTNNAAELMAYRQACKESLNRAFPAVKFHLDSKYVLDNSQGPLNKWRMNDWKTSVGTNIANKELWQDIAILQDNMKKAGIQTSYQWVKGHSGVVGNEWADQFATKGLFESSEGVPNTKVAYETLTNDAVPDALATEVVTVEKGVAAIQEEAAKAKPAKKKRVKLPEPNAFIAGRRLLDVCNRPQAKTKDGRTIYMTTTFATKTKGNTDDEHKKAESKNRNLGLVDPDTLEGLVLAKEECPHYSMLRSKQMEIGIHNADFPFLVVWDKFTSKSNWKEIVTQGSDVIVSRGHDLWFHDGVTQLTFYLDVPRLAHDAINSQMTKLDLLEQYENGQLDEADITDVTEYFVETDAKGKQKVSGELAQSNLVVIPTEYKGKKVNLRVTQNLDFPMRGSIGRMIKQEGSITVKLIKHVKTKTSFRYSFVFEGKDNIALFNTPGSNIRLVP